MTTEILADKTFAMRRGTIWHKFIDLYGFHPDGIFCQLTGKQIGIMDSDEIGQLIDSIAGDAESVADDIAMRIFASMRPSLHWNKMRADSLEVMRKARPVETLAYLLNRLFTPISGRYDSLMVNHDRIRVYNRCAEWGVSESSATLMYYLLEIDAKLSLTTEWPTFTLNDVLTQPWPILLEMVEAWHGRKAKQYDDFLKQQELNTKFWRKGNSLARPAFIGAFFESQPISVNAQKKLDKKVESDFFANIFFEVMGKPNLEGKASAPIPEPAKVQVPSTKAPMRFGVKA